MDMCLLQETWLSSKKIGTDFELTKLNLYRTDRRTRGGGTAIAVRKGIEAVVVPVHSMVNLEKIEVTVVHLKRESGRGLYCLSVYNPNARNRLVVPMNRVFKALNWSVNDYIMGGDFNALHEQWGFRRNYPRGIELLSFLEDSRPVFGPRLLAPKASSRPLTDSFPDLFII